MYSYITLQCTFSSERHVMIIFTKACCCVRNCPHLFWETTNEVGNGVKSGDLLLLLTTGERGRENYLYSLMS